MTSNILNKESIKDGDVLLCYSAELHGKDSSVENGYSHAAICIHDSQIIESSAGGVKITNIEKLCEEYGHIAVLRNDGLWNEGRLEALKEFSSECIGKKFNSIGMGKYEARKKAYVDTSTERVKGYFEGTVPSSPSDRDVYFCSELITSAFIRAGIIGESASILFAPETQSPEDIGKDKVFGFFAGYIVSYPGYEIPKNDMFEGSL